MQSFSFTLEEERSAVLVPAGQVGTYLYEPNASVLKAGAFKQIAVRTGALHTPSPDEIETSLSVLFPPAKTTIFILFSPFYSNHELYKSPH